MTAVPMITIAPLMAVACPCAKYVTAPTAAVCKPPTMAVTN